MIGRLTAVIALVALAFQPAVALGVTSAVQFGPPTIRLEAADTLYATRTAFIQVPQGQTSLALPLAELGISAADVLLAVQPDDCVGLVAVRTGKEGARWLLESTREVEAVLALTYPVKECTWAIEYAATLATDGSLDLKAALRLTNGQERALEDARFVGEFARATLSLSAGQSITVEQPWLSANISAAHIARTIVYDRARHGDSAVELLTVSGDAPGRATALPAGPVRVYAAPEAGGEFIRTATLSYVPPHEPIELALGSASGILVSRTLETTKEVNKRLDARDKITLFDLEETWLLEARNLREDPVDLLVTEHHEGVWKLEKCGDDCERVDAETLTFDVTLAPGEHRNISFCIRHLNRQP